MGYAPGSGFALSNSGQSPDQGHSPTFREGATAGHSPASHQPAEPERCARNILGGAVAFARRYWGGRSVLRLILGVELVIKSG